MITKGIKNVCHEANAAENFINLMSNLTKSQVTSKLLDIFPKEDSTCSLSTTGRIRIVIINPKPETS